MKNSIILSILILSISLTSCKTAIPERDTVNPTMAFQLYGNGISAGELQITESFDFDNQALYLQRDLTYSILFSGKDAGGVSKVSWELPNSSIIEFPDSLAGSWYIEPSEDISIKIISSDGNRADPRSSIILGTKIIGHSLNTGGPENRDFKFTVIDYHGNRFMKTLRVIIGAGPTRVGPR